MLFIVDALENSFSLRNDSFLAFVLTPTIPTGVTPKSPPAGRQAWP